MMMRQKLKMPRLPRMVVARLEATCGRKAWGITNTMA